MRSVDQLTDLNVSFADAFHQACTLMVRMIFLALLSFIVYALMVLFLANLYGVVTKNSYIDRTLRVE